MPETMRIPQAVKVHSWFGRHRSRRPDTSRAQFAGIFNRDPAPEFNLAGTFIFS